MSRYYKLDNAAQIYPIVSTRHRQGSYRLAAVLYEDIDKENLHTALNIAIKRFPFFKVQLKKGFFWFYFEENNLDVPVFEDSIPYIKAFNLEN